MVWFQILTLVINPCRASPVHYCHFQCIALIFMNLRKFSTHILRIIILGGYNLFLCGLFPTGICKTVSLGSTYLYHAKCTPIPSPPPTSRCCYSYLSLEPTEVHIWELIALVKKKGAKGPSKVEHTLRFLLFLKPHSGPRF